ncbi:RNA demethylase ALKBH9B-like protein [Drosera capensis]
MPDLHSPATFYPQGRKVSESVAEPIDLASKNDDCSSPSMDRDYRKEEEQAGGRWMDGLSDHSFEYSEKDSSRRRYGNEGDVSKKAIMPSKNESELHSFLQVKRKMDFICLERIDRNLVNVLEGLELHNDVFDAYKQKAIVDYIYDLQDMGRKQKLRARTFSAPTKWMRGKGCQTIHFGCCYNYATDKHGNPPGILKSEMVDPLPPLFKLIIKRLVRWCVLPPSCMPDSCIVNIYDEGNCIPPHIDNHDFVRPFCTISFLGECNMVFGRELKTISFQWFCFHSAACRDIDNLQENGRIQPSMGLCRGTRSARTPAIVIWTR